MEPRIFLAVFVGIAVRKVGTAADAALAPSQRESILANMRYDQRLPPEPQKAAMP